MTKTQKALSALMTKKELTPAAAAAKLGVSRQTFHKWIKGGKLSRSSMLLIHSKWKIPLEQLGD